MTKKLLSFAMALLLVLSAIPVNSLAWPGSRESTYGSKIGWEYATVSVKSGGGYTLTDPGGSSNLGNKVTVTSSDGTEWTEGTLYDGLLSDTSDNTVTVTCEDGYYIAYIILACEDRDNNGNPFNCRTAATDDAFGYENTVYTLNEVTMNLKDLHSHSNHTSGVDGYYLMIMLGETPDPVYVGYDAGMAGDTRITANPISESDLANTALVDSATRNGSFFTLAYPVADGSGTKTTPEHTVLNVSEEAKAEAYAAGYEFTGWEVTYYVLCWL